MEAKAFLSRARQADRRVSALLERRRRCRELEEALDGKRGHNLARLDDALAQRVEEWAATVMEVEAVIDALDDPPAREVLRYRYLGGLSWQEISARTCYSREWLWRMHARGLEEVGRRGIEK